MKQLDLKPEKGGICAAAGFKAAGIHCGLRKNASRPDLALIYSDEPCAAAGVFTRNLVKAAPVLLDMKLIADGRAQAIIANSGNANACAPDDEENAARMNAAAAAALGLDKSAVLVSSTGVIGQRLNIDCVEKGAAEAAAALSYDGSDDAARAIMTTDTAKKELAYSLFLGGRTVRIGAIAKGSGMIHPNMGTMLCYITTDCAISAPMLDKALRAAVNVSFNRVSVDGDTSTNDSCIILANAAAGNEPITDQNSDYELFAEALRKLCVELARMIAADGEGASHLITCVIKGASDEAKAENIARSVINSPLTKAAIFGRDANWGRVLCAMGYSGESFDRKKTDIYFSSENGDIKVCSAGTGMAFDEELAERILSAHEVIIIGDLNEGGCEATCWGCDLTYDYVKINGSYRT
ncbi:MAG: bifunctional glutamate N-acetyltransferase/amino-acid acetyltransferase ArgJ [Oscillospiraceae bacterium]|nr:bifunctional glutamate N-acetyltransferase/amino-acid acetyltransferase ArgJ [Oscillospiraceae bacterium]